MQSAESAESEDSAGKRGTAADDSACHGGADVL